MDVGEVRRVRVSQGAGSCSPARAARQRGPTLYKAKSKTQKVLFYLKKQLKKKKKGSRASLQRLAPPGSLHQSTWGRIVKWKWSTRGEGLRSSTLLWSAKGTKTLETAASGEHSGAGRGRSRRGLKGDDALFMAVKHTAHWFNGNTILIFRSLKTKALFLAVCHCLIG